VLQVRCTYCGAHRNDDGSCRGCGAESPSVACRRCGKAVPAPLERCNACGTECLAWKDAGQHEIRCPRCMGRLERADVGAVHLEQCARCLGCFLRTEDFSHLVDSEESGQHLQVSSFVPTDGRALPRQTLLALVRCPHCPREMDRARFDQRAEIVIDVCATHGMWLDAGELPMILVYLRARHTGHITQSAAAREENAHWDRVEQSLANEARIVDSHIANATPQKSGSAAGVIVATAALGPWAGLFVALRNMNKR